MEIKIIKKTEDGIIDFVIPGVTNEEKGEVHRLRINSDQDVTETIKKAAQAIVNERQNPADLSSIPDTMEI